jgi:ubiquinone/menaquinone biosynthesis C-methylase UbiE
MVRAVVFETRVMQSFDQFGSNYEHLVQASVDFTGLEYDFFVKAKARLIKRFAAGRISQVKSSLLDVGCGVGTLHYHLADTFTHICGVDVSPKSIEIAKERHVEFDYRVMERTCIPYPAAIFDMVTAINVLHHIDPPARQSLLLELKRVVRPDGLVCVIEHNPFNPLTRLAVLRCPFDRDAHLLRATETRRLLRGAGLVRVQSSYFLLGPFSSETAYSVERWLRRLPLGAQYIAVGERPAGEQLLQHAGIKAVRHEDGACDQHRAQARAVRAALR